LKQLLLYLPVIHAGYEEFLARHPDAAEILLLGSGFREQYPELAKDIRALPPVRAARYLALLPGRPPVRVVEPGDLPAAVHGDLLVLPDEAVMRDLAARCELGRGRALVFDRTFLRWDRDWSRAASPPGFDTEVTTADLPRELLGRAWELSRRSSDWWRQVGAVAAREHRIIGCAWNRHLPTEYAPYLSGDPRDGFTRGVRADLSTALHAEAGLIAAAARDGTPVAGADLYVTTFPCPACARLIAGAGFARCFFAGGYSVLDGEQVLRAAGVTLIRVVAAGDARTPGGR
jgi:dCMP deaminase